MKRRRPSEGEMKLPNDAHRGQMRQRGRVPMRPHQEHPHWSHQQPPHWPYHRPLHWPLHWPPHWPHEWLPHWPHRRPLHQPHQGCPHWPHQRPLHWLIKVLLIGLTKILFKCLINLPHQERCRERHVKRGENSDWLRDVTWLITEAKGRKRPHFATFGQISNF